MANRLVSVNDANELPDEVQAALVGGVQTHFQAMTDTATSAASTATSQASAATAAKTDAETARAAAVVAKNEAVAIVTGDLDPAATALVNNTASALRLALDEKYRASFSGTYAARPAVSAVPVGSMYYSTDIPVQYRSNGSMWVVTESAAPIVPVADAAARTALASALAAAGRPASTTDPTYVHRSDSKTLERDDGAGWRVAVPTRRGNARLAADTPITGAGGWTTLASVTADTLGGLCVVDFSGIFFNGTSGANREFIHRVTCDGSIVGPEFLLTAVLANTPRTAFGTNVESAPATGSHTWALQAHSDAGAAIVVSRASLTVTEHP